MKKLFLILAATAACMVFATSAKAQLNYIVDCMGQFCVEDGYVPIPDGTGSARVNQIRLYWEGGYYEGMDEDTPKIMLQSMINWYQQPELKNIMLIDPYQYRFYGNPWAGTAYAYLVYGIVSHHPLYGPALAAKITFINQLGGRPDVVIRNYQ